MTPQQLQLAHRSFVVLMPDLDRAVSAFYARLFELDPSLRPMFPAEIHLQQLKFGQMLDTLLGDPERFEALIPAVQRMGVRHMEYGVTDEHYTTVAGALLHALEQTLGSHFTEEVREAWAAVYTQLAKVMQEAARAA